mgnify:FL=1
MLLLLSSQLISQTTNTKPTNCLSDAQISKIFKGLKQGEYLKLRVEKAEETILSANKVIDEQTYIIANKDKVINIKDALYTSLVFQNKMDMEIKDSQIDKLNETMKVNEEIYKSDKKKKFWSGIKIGGVVGVGIATTALLLILK